MISFAASFEMRSPRSSARSGAPVIPVAVKGSGQVVRDGRPGLPAVRVKVGPAVDLSGLEGKKSAMYTQAAQRTRGAVAELYESF